MSIINKGFVLIDTYPEYLIEPKKIKYNTLIFAADYRSLRRIPILNYYYRGKKLISGIWHLSQNISKKSDDLKKTWY